MRSVFVRCVSILAIIGVLASGGVTLAQGQDQTPVVDGAGIFGDRIVEVQTAAEWLQTTGADVRVRTILSYNGFGNLDQYEQDLERRSPSWLAPDGNRKNNLIVIIICLQGGGQTGLYYGEQWEGILDENWNSLQSDVMNPHFRTGDYAGGAVAGLDAIGSLIEEGGSSEAVSSGSGLSAGAAVLLSVVALTAIVIGLVLARSHRRSKDRRAGLRQKALLARQGAAAGINELIESVQMLEIKVDVTTGRVAPEDATPLRNGLAEARHLVDTSSQRYSELSHSAADPTNPKLGEAELAAIEPEFRSILENLRRARESIRALEGQVATLLEMVDSFPARVAEIDAAMERAVITHDELGRAGFNTTYAVDLLARGRATLAMAHDLAAGKRFREGTEYVSLARAQVQQSVQVAEELPQKKQEAEAALPALATRIVQVTATIERGRTLFERLSATYAETSWTAVRGNGTEAENRIDWAEDALDEARAAVSPERQEWHRALESVAGANGWLAEAETLIASISELEVSLLAAQRDSAGEIAAAQADVAKAWDYINRYDEDIRESLEDDLRAAEATIATAREELTRDKPDYLRVCKLAREANEAVDRILVQAQDEHETAERLRARAAGALRDAQAKVTMVSRFIQVRHPFVQDRARNRLVEATAMLQQAETATDVNARISLAERAESAASEAFSLAQTDVSTSWGHSSQSSGGLNVPSVLFPTGGMSGGTRPWGSRPTASPRPGGSSRPGSAARRGGGGSTSWGSGSRSAGGRSGGMPAGRGGGSKGW